MDESNCDNILPLYQQGNKIRDGFLIKSPSFCHKGGDKCNSYYSQIRDKSGVHTCPYGFNSYVSTIGDSSTIFTAFRVDGLYNKKKTTPKMHKDLYNPILTENQLNDMVQNYEKSTNLSRENAELNEFTRDVIHEVKNFNAQIISKSESLLNKLNESKNREVYDLSKSVLMLAMLVSERFVAYDVTFNPSSIKIGSTFPVSIHGKFEKIKRMYQGEFIKKNVSIRLSGSSTARIDAYPAFDLLPFLIIDNALKYSPSGEQVNVTFNQYRHHLDVTIESIGPQVTESEIDRIFEKKYRSETSKRTNTTGTGIGLFLAKKICDIHQCAISARFKHTGRKISSVEYGQFYIDIRFPIK